MSSDLPVRDCNALCLCLAGKETGMHLYLFKEGFDDVIVNDDFSGDGGSGFS